MLYRYGLIQIPAKRKHFGICLDYFFIKIFLKDFLCGKLGGDCKGFVPKQFDVRMVVRKPFRSFHQLFIFIKSTIHFFEGGFLKYFFKFLPVIVDSVPYTPQGPWIRSPKATGKHGTFDADFYIEISRTGPFIQTSTKMIFVDRFVRVKHQIVINPIDAFLSRSIVILIIDSGQLGVHSIEPSYKTVAHLLVPFAVVVHPFFVVVLLEFFQEVDKMGKVHFLICFL